MAGKWAGVLGSALGGAAEVAVPAALEEQRARIQAMRDKALMQHRSEEAAKDRSFRSIESSRDRESRRGIVEQEMRQRRELHDDEMDYRRDVHQDEMGLKEGETAIQERLMSLAEEYRQAESQEQRNKIAQDILALSGRPETLAARSGSQSQSGDMQMLAYLETRLGMSPEEAFATWEATKNNPTEFIEKYVIAAMGNQSEMGKALGEAPTPEELAKEAKSVYQSIHGQEKKGDDGGAGIKFLGFED